MLKEGVAEDAANQERIAKLLRFASTHAATPTSRPSRSPTTSARMKERQDAIYYITADGFAAARNSPHLEIFRKLGVEVLLMYDRVDEWVVSSLTEFDGKPLQSVAKGDLDLEQARRRGGEPGAGQSRPASTRTCSSACRRRSRIAPAPCA